MNVFFFLKKKNHFKINVSRKLYLSRLIKDKKDRHLSS